MVPTPTSVAVLSTVVTVADRPGPDLQRIVAGLPRPVAIRLLRKLGRTSAEAGPYPRRVTEAVYHRPLQFDDEIEVRLGVEKAGRSAVTFGWQILRGNELCVEGKHTVIHIGPDGRGAPWPDNLLSGLTQTA